MASNNEHWLSYTDNLSSPQNFVQWTWFSVVCSHLQRRVWIGDEGSECYPNLFIVLTGRPGVGKGLCIKVAKEFTTHWKEKDKIRLDHNQISQHEMELAAMMEEKDSTNATNGGKDSEPLLIPQAPDDITYEALTKAIAQSYRRVQYPKPDKEGKFILGTYGHSSLAFYLPEMASLVTRKNALVMPFMLGLYDSPTDYKYVTKNQGEDHIRRGCINFLAGTTPDDITECFDDKILKNGFSSRTFFIYSHRNRKSCFFLRNAKTSDNEYSKKVLLHHLKSLTGLFGKVTIDSETEAFLENWWQKFEEDSSKRTNKSHKMEPYYARKNLHVMKVAMALHFGESLNMHIPLERFKEAINLLDEEEKNMHFALAIADDNPIARITKKIIEYLKIKPRTDIDIACETHSIADKKQREEALNFLVDTNQIRSYEEAIIEGLEDKIRKWRLIE